MFFVVAGLVILAGIGIYAFELRNPAIHYWQNVYWLTSCLSCTFDLKSAYFDYRQTDNVPEQAYKGVQAL